MTNIRHYTMLALLAFVGNIVARPEYFTRNREVVPNSRDRYQYNLPISSSDNRYKSSPSTYASNPSYEDDYVVRQNGQPEVPQYSKVRDQNTSPMMQHDRVIQQEQTLQIPQQGQTGRVPQALLMQPKKSPGGY